MALYAPPVFADEKALNGEKTPVVENEAGEEAKTETFEKLAARIREDRTVDPKTQASLIAQDLEKINAEEKALKEESQALIEKPSGTAYDQEVVQAKLGLAEKKKELAERKAAFLQAKIQIQNNSHARIQFFLTDVFSDDASFFVITKQLQEIEQRKAQRFTEERQLKHEINVVRSRIRIEEQYLAAKKVLLAAARDAERPAIQETVSIAEERLKVFKETQVLLEEQLQFTGFRIATLNDFDQLIRVRRMELLKDRVFTKKPLSYVSTEVVLTWTLLFLLAIGFWFRTRIENAVLSLPLFLSREGVLVCLKALWFLGILALGGWGVLSLLEYRAAAIVLGLVYLNVAFGLILFMIAKGLIKTLFMKFLQKIAKATQIEIKQSSSVFLLVRTVLMWVIFGVIFYEILDYWAIEGEAIRWLSGIVNEPLFQSEKIKISVWILARSLLVFWFFYVAARFLNGILRARVYPNSSLDKNSQHAIRTVIQFSCLVIGAMAGIQLLGIDLGVLTVFSGTLGIGIGFGLQEIVKNVFSGFVIFFERPIRMGDVVEVGGVPGVVKSIRTRSTIVNTFDNISIVVPNSEFLTDRVVNWSHSDRIVRIESRVGVDYASDAEQVKQTLLEIARANKDILSQPEPSVVFEEFADSALLFRLLYWVDVEDRMEVKSQINFAIHARFKEKGISIPFPQRDLHLRSSDFEFKKEQK
jgi:small-conductance mechanosensitive channel